MQSAHRMVQAKGTRMMTFLVLATLSFASILTMVPCQPLSPGGLPVQLPTMHVTAAPPIYGPSLLEQLLLRQALQRQALQTLQPRGYHSGYSGYSSYPSSRIERSFARMLLDWYREGLTDFYDMLNVM